MGVSRSSNMRLLLAAVLIATVLGQRNLDRCKSRDGNAWVKPGACKWQCCIQSSDRGAICGSQDDCDHASGTWWVMLLLTVGCVFLLLVACICLLNCFNIPIPCCDRQLKSLMQRWSNRATLNARTESAARQQMSVEPRQSVWNKL